MLTSIHGYISEPFLALWQETSSFLSTEANPSIISLVEHLKASDYHMRLEYS